MNNETTEIAKHPLTDSTVTEVQPSSVLIRSEPRSGLQVAYESVKAEAMQSIDKGDPQSFKRGTRLLKIMRVLCDQIELDKSPKRIREGEALRARGIRGNVYACNPHYGMDDLDFDDDGYVNGPFAMPAPFPLPEPDGPDFTAERKLTKLQLAATRQRVDEANARVAACAEAKHLHELINSGQLQIEHENLLRKRLDALIKTIGDGT